MLPAAKLVMLLAFSIQPNKKKYAFLKSIRLGNRTTFILSTYKFYQFPARYLNEQLKPSLWYKGKAEESIFQIFYLLLKQ